MCNGENETAQRRQSAALAVFGDETDDRGVEAETGEIADDDHRHPDEDEDAVFERAHPARHQHLADEAAELLARVRAAQRRSLTEAGEPVYNSGPLCVDFAARQVKLDGKEVKLTPTEYSLLRVLVQNAGKVVTHRQLLRTVWGEKAESQAQYLRVYITHLRRKLEAERDSPTLIRTEVGIGYRLSAANL